MTGASGELRQPRGPRAAREAATWYVGALIWCWALALLGTTVLVAVQEHGRPHHGRRGEVRDIADGVAGMVSFFSPTLDGLFPFALVGLVLTIRLSSVLSSQRAAACGVLAMVSDMWLTMGSSGSAALPTMAIALAVWLLAIRAERNHGGARAASTSGTDVLRSPGHVILLGVLAVAVAMLAT